MQRESSAVDEGLVAVQDLDGYHRASEAGACAYPAAVSHHLVSPGLARNDEGSPRPDLVAGTLKLVTTVEQALCVGRAREVGTPALLALPCLDLARLAVSPAGLGGGLREVAPVDVQVAVGGQGREVEAGPRRQGGLHGCLRGDCPDEQQQD